MIRALVLKNFMKRLFPSYEDRMNAFLSQATDQVHLEFLQREWDRMSYEQRSQW
jgi:hypothetical protein